MYSNDPNNDTRGGLPFDFIQYNAPYYFSDYFGAHPAPGNGFLYSISPTIDVSLTDVTKVYDQTSNAALTQANYVLGGVLGGDTITLNPATGTYYDLSGVNLETAAGSNWVVKVSGLTIASETNGGKPVYGTNTDGFPVLYGAYQGLPATVTGNGDITQRPLTVTATGQNKVYDATTAAIVALSNNAITGDVVTDSYTSALFSDKNVANGKTINVAGISISGADAGNYTLTGPTTTTTANITPAPLTVTATGQNKVYDATTAAIVALSNNAITGDVVTDSYTSALFSDKNVANGKTINVAGISISGADAGNYTLTGPTDHHHRQYHPGIAHRHRHGQNKVYDATTAAIVALSNNAITGDVVTDSYTSALFSDKNVANGKTINVAGISISGADAGNYTLTDPTTTTTANITPASLTVTANDAGRTFGEPNPAFSASFAGLAPGDTSAVVTGLQLETNADRNSVPGQYTIIPSGATSPNYQIAYVNGTLTIIVTPVAPLLASLIPTDNLANQMTPAVSADGTQILSTTAAIGLPPLPQGLPYAAAPPGGPLQNELLFSNDGNMELWGAFGSQ